MKGLSLAVLLAAPAFLVACTSSSEPTGTDNTVQVLDNHFAPDSVTVTLGATVTWTWAGSVAHNVTADNAAFTPSETQAAGKHLVTFNTAGVFHYHCTIHGEQGMKGVVVVQSDSPAIGS